MKIKRREKNNKKQGLGKMYAVIIFVVFLGIVNGHYSNIPKIKKLKADIADIKLQQDAIYNAMDQIETNVTQRIQNLKVGRTTSGISATDLDAEEFEGRLSILEGTVDALKRYLAAEKREDASLKIRSEKAIGQINDKVKEADLLVDSTINSISQSVSLFKDQLLTVNESAQRNMHIEGVIFYGGVGTSCSAGNDACIVPRSECRGGRCQCEPGYSYDAHAKDCVKTCQKYGPSFQSVENYVIRGNNDLVLEDISFLDCKQYCLNATDFECHSIDYFQRWRHCYLSSVTKSEALDDWEYNSVGYHFQRDCKE